MKAHLVLVSVALLASQSSDAAPLVVARSQDSITRNVAVPLGDIDRSNPNATKRIRARLRRAAAQVCRAPLSDRDAVGWDTRGCFVATIDRASAAAGVGPAPRSTSGS